MEEEEVGAREKKDSSNLSKTAIKVKHAFPSLSL